MQTTIADFARFTQAVLNGKGLSKKSREEMLGPQIQITSKREFPTLDDETTDEKTTRLRDGGRRDDGLLTTGLRTTRPKTENEQTRQNGNGFSELSRFFFDGFEYYKQQVDGGLERAFVPTPAMLNGDFSALTSGYGNAEAGSHPLLVATPTAPAAGSWIGYDQRAAAGCTITGGVLAPACIDPNAQKLLMNYLPTPNVNPGSSGLFIITRWARL